jgi:hypothetical protein
VAETPTLSPTLAPHVPCAKITATTVSWLWEPYLARGKLAVLDGDPGTGKSFVTIDLAARISTGAPMPCGRPGVVGNVLLLNAEDDARDTIRPRIGAAGADLNRVNILFAPGLDMSWRPQFPEDLRQLARTIRETAAVLVVLDPMMSFLAPNTSANSDQSMRNALGPLGELAAQTGACILLVRHLRKSGGASAIYRGMGSIGIVGAVRTGLMIARHPDDPELRVFAQSKTNVGAPGPTLGFRLSQRDGTGPTVVNWTGSLDVTADELFGTNVPLRAGSRTRERAADWLRAFLADGPRRASEVFEAAHAAGIPERTLYRVKATVGVRSNAVKCDGKLEWWWYDPVADREAAKEKRAELNHLANLLLRKRAPAPAPAPAQPKPKVPPPRDDYSDVPMG